MSNQIHIQRITVHNIGMADEGAWVLHAGNFAHPLAILSEHDAEKLADGLEEFADGSNTDQAIGVAGLVWRPMIRADGTTYLALPGLPPLGPPPLEPVAIKVFLAHYYEQRNQREQGVKKWA